MIKTRYIHTTRIIVLFTYLAFFQNIARAQSGKDLTELKIGDPIPEALWNRSLQVANSQEEADTITLNRYKSKLIILDFWSTWCTVCVKTFPKLDSLESAYSGKLKILLTTPQESKVAGPFLAKRNFRLESIVNGKFLSGYFPHQFVPHEVWIKDGKVFAVTSHKAVTNENIRGVLSGKLTSLPEMKADFDYDPCKPLLLDGNGGKTGDLQYRSLITGYIDGIGSSGVYTDSLGQYKIRALNATVPQLYLSVFRLGRSLPLSRANRCILEFDKAKILPPEDVPDYSPEARGKYYCYELIVPPILKPSANDLMLEDLNRFFGAAYHIRGAVEKRATMCWALEKKGSIQKLVSHSDKPLVNADIPGQVTFCKQSVARFCITLSGVFRNQPFPIVDCTGITEDIDITFPTNETDINKFNAFLNPYGLHLRPKRLKVDMLVIKDIIKK